MKTQLYKWTMNWKGTVSAVLYITQTSMYMNNCVKSANYKSINDGKWFFTEICNAIQKGVLSLVNNLQKHKNVYSLFCELTESIINSESTI